MNIAIERGGVASKTGPVFTPERSLELKAKARELFVQGFEYSSALDESFACAMRAKPVWE